ncbi:hypothetical protein Moror_7051 [Moniliophthora roreri MCA 2997]|uniref:Uncharacterized protein n=1 Tax=Moniliophthora roreri (strain MCA 2997) TaxID=1381753 RepID=V2XU65_MONRO|nr:hypothetical protein Moror_7051 [Moniliophthora roreri MCA 2997]
MTTRKNEPRILFASPSVSMEALPHEILSLICSLACTDAGETFKCLRLVCKKFHDICIPLRYQTISICTSEGAAFLSSRLLATPSHLRRIYHLHITLPSSEAKDLYRDVKNIFEVLQLSAPTVETLTFSCPNAAVSSTVIARLFRLRFPRLEELALYGLYPLPDARIYMPRLDRLHLSGNRSPSGLFQWGRLKEAFPSLTHLRVSGISSTEAFCRELEYWLRSCRTGMGNLDGHPDHETLQLLSDNDDGPIVPRLVLEHLVIQPVWQVSTGVPRAGRNNKFSSVTKSLEGLVSTHRQWLDDRRVDGKYGLQLVLGESMLDPSASYVCDVLHRDWVSRLNGGLGLWKV